MSAASRADAALRSYVVEIGRLIDIGRRLANSPADHPSPAVVETAIRRAFFHSLAPLRGILDVPLLPANVRRALIDWVERWVEAIRSKLARYSAGDASNKAA